MLQELHRVRDADSSALDRYDYGSTSSKVEIMEIVIGWLEATPWRGNSDLDASRVAISAIQRVAVRVGCRVAVILWEERCLAILGHYDLQDRRSGYGGWRRRWRENLCYHRSQGD